MKTDGKKPTLAEMFAVAEDRAKARASRPTSVMRQDPLVITFGTAQGKSASELDDFFRKYAKS